MLAGAEGCSQVDSLGFADFSKARDPELREFKVLGVSASKFRVYCLGLGRGFEFRASAT